MADAIAVRFAGPEDIVTIGFLAQEIWPSAYRDILSADQLRYMMNLIYSPDALWKQMFEQKHLFLIMEEEDEPIGFASFSEMDAPGVYKLHKIYILPGRQAKGLGKFMIDFIIAHIRSAAATAVRLNVNRHNKARHFYEKLGFAIIYEEDIDIGNNYFMNDYVMELKLPASQSI